VLKICGRAAAEDLRAADEGDRLLRDAARAGSAGIRLQRRPGRPEGTAPLGASYFNMRKTSIYGGTNEIQKNIIAKMVLAYEKPQSSMDFSLSDEQQLLKDSVDRFVPRELRAARPAQSGCGGRRIQPRPLEHHGGAGLARRRAARRIRRHRRRPGGNHGHHGRLRTGPGGRALFRQRRARRQPDPFGQGRTRSSARSCRGWRKGACTSPSHSPSAAAVALRPVRRRRPPGGAAAASC
jgi:alkylation response protein AidB-like acyl-CoA dehydrogenase